MVWNASPILEEIYAISGMMFRLEVIHGEVKFAP